MIGWILNARSLVGQSKVSRFIFNLDSTHTPVQEAVQISPYLFLIGSIHKNLGKNKLPANIRF